MARRSRPSRSRRQPRSKSPQRKLPFGLSLAEVIGLGLSVALIAAGAGVLHAYTRSAEQVSAQGHCVTASIDDTRASIMSLGHVADISFEFDGALRREELYYGREALPSTVVVCLDPNDPSVFYAQDGSGASYHEWTQDMVATALVVVGAVGLVLGLGTRQWPWTKPYPPDRPRPPKMRRRKLRRLQQMQEQEERRSSRRAERVNLTRRSRTP